MTTLLTAAAAVAVGILLLAALLHALPKLGAPGKRLAAACTRVPTLDLVVSAFTWVPWAAGAAAGGWPGLAGAILGQLAALLLWTLAHELANREAARGPRIVKFLNRRIGRARNYAGLYLTVPALPAFWAIRAAQILFYPPLARVVGFPRYRQSEWINVSRQKFSGLVGHDLIWCLYCDWMTGVYALGGEMLRNVESFWCPIRFYDGKKCDNCKVDFPDINGGWVGADGTMADVEQTMERMYGGGRHEWFGHPARLTVNGDPAPAAQR